MEQRKSIQEFRRDNGQCDFIKCRARLPQPLTCTRQCRVTSGKEVMDGPRSILWRQFQYISETCGKEEGITSLGYKVQDQTVSTAAFVSVVDGQGPGVQR